jgi:hypothetical protein
MGASSLVRGTYLRMLNQDTALVQVGQRVDATQIVRAKVIVSLAVAANATCFLATEAWTSTPWLLVGALTYTELPNTGLSGTIIQRHGPAPSGYVAADGSIVSRTDFAGIFDSMGTRYGVGDGSTTFQLPNLPNHIIKT